MNRSKGFTLIELLIVLAIIGIISAIAIPALLGQRERAKATATKDNTVAVCGDLASTLVLVCDPVSERPTNMATTQWPATAAGYKARADETVKWVIGQYGKQSFLNAINTYSSGPVYFTGSAASATANDAGKVYVDTTSALVASNPYITVTGIYKDTNGTMQTLVKTVPCD